MTETSSAGRSRALSRNGGLDPSEWAAVHDERSARHFAFWRGLELAVEACSAEIKPGDRWLDVGCGPGHLGAVLARKGARVLGVDLDPRMARYADRRWQLQTAVADAAQLPVADQTCAGILATSLLGYLPLPARFFVAAARALRPQGVLCFTAMNRHSALLLAAKLTTWPRCPRMRYTAHDPGELTAALERAGFEPLTQVLYGHFLTVGGVTFPRPLTAQRCERRARPGQRSLWARQLLVVARRLPTGGEQPRQPCCRSRTCC